MLLSTEFYTKVYMKLYFGVLEIIVEFDGILERSQLGKSGPSPNIYTMSIQGMVTKQKGEQ